MHYAQNHLDLSQPQQTECSDEQGEIMFSKMSELFGILYD